MMILPLADSLQNCLQNLTSRIAGIDNEQISSRAMGMGTMLGYGLGAIKEQFNTPSSSLKSNNSNGNNNSLNSFLGRAKSVINPQMKLSSEKDYNGNNSPIRDVMKKTSSDKESLKMSEGIKSNSKNFARNFAKTGFNVSKNYLKLGANLTEGNFNTNNKNNYKNNLNTTEFTNNTNLLNSQEKGDTNEFKENR